MPMFSGTPVGDADQDADSALQPKPRFSGKLVQPDVSSTASPTTTPKPRFAGKLVQPNASPSEAAALKPRFSGTLVKAAPQDEQATPGWLDTVKGWIKDATEPSSANGESLAKRAAMSVPREIASQTSGAWIDLKRDFLASLPDTTKPPPKSFWDEQKQEFNRLVSTGKTAVDAFNLVTAPISGAISGAISTPLSKVMARVPGARKPGETLEQTEEEARQAVDTALMTVAPEKGGLARASEAARVGDLLPAVKTSEGRIAKGLPDRKPPAEEPGAAARAQKAAAAKPPTATEQPKGTAAPSKAAASPGVRLVQSIRKDGEPPKPPIGSAEASPPGPGEPEVKALKGFVRDTEDRLYAIRQSGTADKAEVKNTLKAMTPAEKDPARQERIYHAIEEQKLDQLAPEDRAVYDRWVKPINEEESRIYAKLKNNGVVMPREGYVHRMVQGRSPMYDPRDPEASGDLDVVVGRSMGKLPQTTGSLQHRKFLALDDGKGTRHVIAAGKDGTTIFENGKPRDLGPRTAGLQLGDDITIGGKHYNVVDATTREIEANTETRYYKNALVNSIDNLLALRRVERSIDFLEEFKKDSRFLNYAERVGGNHPPTPGWITTKLPQFDGWRMDPRIAHALDDFYGQHNWGPEWLTKANRFLTTSMFVDPVPHLHNVATHWYVGRGWDNFVPTRWKGSAKNAAKALIQVINQGEDYRRMLREGGALLYGDVANRDFYTTMLRTMGQDIVKDPDRWGRVIKASGMRRPADFVAALYRGARHVLWAGSDAFMLQRYYDLMDKGMSAKEAIRDAERHIPNYRIPSTVFGDRHLSLLLRNPNIMNFGRYRYGQLASYMRMVRDLVKNDRPGARLEATGNLAALGVLMFFIYPMLDAAIQKISRDRNAKVKRAGPGALVQDGIDVTQGEKALTEAIAKMIQTAPASTTIAETLLNRNMFRGQPVLEPGDEKDLITGVEKGNVHQVAQALKRLPTQALQELADHFYPAGQALQVVKDMHQGGDKEAAAVRFAQRLIDIQRKSQQQLTPDEIREIQQSEAEKRAMKTQSQTGIPQF